jgi:hypothetical protein
MIFVLQLHVIYFDRMAESMESRKYDNSRSKRGIASASSLSGSEFTGKRINDGGTAREGEVGAGGVATFRALTIFCIAECFVQISRSQ